MGKKKSAVILKMYLLLGFVTVVILVSMISILLMGRRMTAVYTSLIDATMEIKLEATMGHLWFEEVISGDSSESLENVYELIDNSDWYAKAMLEGGENPEGKFIPLKDADLREHIELVRERIAEFRAITGKRWEMKDLGGIGSEIDQQYDAVFRDFIKMTDEVEIELQALITAKLKRFEVIQSSLIGLCLTVFLIVGVTLRRLLLAQLRDEIKLRGLNQQLDASNQQLLANEQQLRAANQQLDASNQQLRAGEQQLRAFNQQLQANEQQLCASNQQLLLNEKTLKASRGKYRNLSKSLEWSEQFLNATNQTIKVGGWEIDILTNELRVTHEINRIFELPLDYKPTLEELTNFIHPEDRPILQKANAHSIESGEPYDIEIRLITVNGREVWGQGIGKAHVSNGKTVKLSGTFQDISERKQAQIEREGLMRVLAAKNDELQSIVYISSHDLRSPLVNINGFSGVLIEGCERILKFIEKLEIDEDVKKEIMPIITEEIPEALSFISSSTDRMAKLIEGLLKVSRIGTCEVDLKKIDMNKVVSMVADTVKFKAGITGAEIILGDLPDCTGDEDQVAQVFANLIDNAIKYLDPDRKGIVRISGERKGGKSIYFVEDNGVGIAPNHENKVFGIYQRLNPNGPVEGEGLGLTIVRRIIDRHNGDIQLESKEGLGTKFTVSLPK